MALIGGVMAIVYGLALTVLRNPELRTVSAPFTSRLRRSR
jgi:hypothetical protein